MRSVARICVEINLEGLPDCMEIKATRFWIMLVFFSGGQLATCMIILKETAMFYENRLKVFFQVREVCLLIKKVTETFVGYVSMFSKAIALSHYSWQDL